MAPSTGGMSRTISPRSSAERPRSQAAAGSKYTMSQQPGDNAQNAPTDNRSSVSMIEEDKDDDDHQQVPRSEQPAAGFQVHVATDSAAQLMEAARRAGFPASQQVQNQGGSQQIGPRRQVIQRQETEVLDHEPGQLFDVDMRAMRIQPLEELAIDNTHDSRARHRSNRGK